MRSMTDSGFKTFNDFLVSVTTGLKDRGILRSEWMAALAVSMGMDVVQGKEFQFAISSLWRGNEWLDELYILTSSEQCQKLVKLIRNSEMEYDEIHSVLAEEGILDQEHTAYLKSEIFESISYLISST